MSNALSRRSLLACALGAGAAGVIAALPTAAETMDPAARVIQQYYTTLFPAVQAAKGLSGAERAQRIAPAILSAFDIATMARLAVGPEWAKFTPAQQAQVRDAFSKFILADYASQLNDYSGESFKVEPKTEARGGDRIVKTTVGTTQVNYLVRGSRIIDIYANGTVSELATRRAEFSSILASGGPKALIEHLQQKTQKLSG
jgi:phospholipid transport system substrate-binding protein